MEGRTRMSTVAEVKDRRSAIRFPIERQLKFSDLGKRNKERGQGETVNLSSSGVLFTTNKVMVVGRPLELNISWPGRFDSGTPLVLIIRGHIIRFEEGRAAVEIERYHFVPINH